MTITEAEADAGKSHATDCGMKAETFLSELADGGASGADGLGSASGLQHFICVQSQPQQFLAGVPEAATAGANRIA